MNPKQLKSIIEQCFDSMRRLPLDRVSDVCDDLRRMLAMTHRKTIKFKYSVTVDADLDSGRVKKVEFSYGRGRVSWNENPSDIDLTPGMFEEHGNE